MSKLAQILSLILPTIFNPATATRGEADWFARLSTQYEPMGLVGGGVLVGDGTWVLTAAHVAEGYRPQRVHLKAYSRGDLRNPAKVQETCVHPGFVDGTSASGVFMPDDLALLKIDQQGPALPLASSAPALNDEGSIYGWGQTGKGKKASKFLNKNKDTVRIEKLDGRSFEATSMACTGDSGGPFLVGGEVVGIYKGDRMVADCTQGQGDGPDHYTAVFSYRPWILDVMAGRGRCKAPPP
jgi:secreted trypsin-like serine protease